MGSFRPSIDLVQKILENATAFEWSWQGLGMFRLMLTREVRLHVWIPESAVPHVTTIHSHPWDFESKIICGKMINRLYMEMSPAAVEHVGFQSVQWMMKQEIVCGPCGGVKSEPSQVALRKISDEIVLSGDDYKLRYDQIHESIPFPGTVSIIKRRFRENTEDAFVYHPINTGWVSAIPRGATTGEVASMAKVALAQLAIDRPA